MKPNVTIRGIVVLFSIIAIGSALRLIKLDTLPYGFFCDESNIGITAKHLLETGRDEYNEFLPFFFQGFGDWRLPIPVYLQIPSIWIFGLSIYSIRLTTTILNIICIVILFKIGCSWKNQTLGLLFALVWAISPWTIHLSRNAMEWSYPLPFFLFSIYAFTNVQKNIFYFLIGTLMISLASYTYYPAIVLAPIFFLIFFVYHFMYHENKKIIILGFVFYVILMTPMAKGIFENKVLSRFNTIINNNEKPVSLKDMVQNFGLVYLKHFDPNFLFMPTKEYEFITRHSIRGIGQIQLLGILGIPFGIFYILFRYNSHHKKSILLSIISLVLLFPLAGIANEVKYPIATRAILGTIPFTFLFGLGLYGMYEMIKGNRIVTLVGVSIFVLAISFETSYFVKKYFVDYPLYSSDYWGWQYGSQPIIKYFIENNQLYDEMYMTGEFNSPIHFISFFDQKNLCNSKCFLGDIDKKNQGKKQLFAIPAHQLKEIESETFTIKDTVLYPDKSPAFYFITFK